MTLTQKIKLTLALLVARAVVTWRRWRAAGDPQNSDISQVYSATSWGKDQLDDPLLTDGVTDFSGGQNSFIRSTLIPANAYQKGVNAIVRDNYEFRTRPGADAITGNPAIPGNTPPPANSTCMGLYYYDTPDFEQLVCASSTGGGTLTISVYQGGAWATNAYTPANSRLAMEQGIDQLMVSDTQNPIVIYDGTNFTPAITGAGVVGNNDPPLGASILTFHQGCMFASGIPPINQSNQYERTAIFADTVMVSNSLAIGAGQWNNTTRSFRVGDGDGQAVVAMASIQDQVLCCFKSDSIWLVNTLDTSNTFNFSADQVTASLSQGIGIVGRDAWCAYGNDLLFMAQDGIRSVQRMQAAAGQWQLSAPLSLPIQDVIQTINWAYAYGIVAQKYQEFAFFFVPTGASTVNNTVIVYNGRLNVFVGTFTNWNGTEVTVSRFSAVNRLVFGDTSGNVNMWKDYADPTTDQTYMDNGVGYPTTLWTRSFQHNDFNLGKQPDHVTLRFTAGNATITATLVCDLEDQNSWTVAPAPTGAILGVTTILPFLLSSVKPSVWKKSVRTAPPANEAYIVLSSPAGWWWSRQIMLDAFANPPQTMAGSP